MTDTPRLGMTLVENNDTIGATGGFKDKVNAALNKLDSTAGVVMCTSTTRPASNLFPGMQAWETDTRRLIRNTTGLVGDWRVVQEDTVNSVGSGYVRAIRPVRYFGGVNHSAFPSIVVLRNGTVLMVWRQGSDHSSTRDGSIKKAVSTDQGRTWSSTTTITTPPVGTDLRDPCVSLSRDGLSVYLVYFKANISLAAAGVYFRKSTDNGTTWSSEVRVEAQPYAASSAGCVELDDGTLVVPWYGRAPGDVFDSVWTSKSVNGGTTWTETKILNGQSLGVALQEPWISMKGQTGVMAYRYNTNASIGVSTTSDNTANWSGAVAKFGGSGRPTIWWANDNTIACIYRRNQGQQGDAVIRVSRDGGVTWNPERRFEKRWAQASTLGMTYAGVDKLSNGATICVLAMENADNSSKLVVTYLGESGTATPFGAIPNEENAIKADVDNTIFSTNFEQPDGGLPYPWFAFGGSVTVTNGEATSAASDNVSDLAAVWANEANVNIEADIKHTGSQSGAGIIFRLTGSTTYMMFTVETGFTVWRLYKVIGGTATQIATASAAPAFGAYQRLWVNAWEDHIMCGIGNFVYINFVHSGSETGGNSSSTFENGYWHGIKLNAQVTGPSANYCRRFVITSN